MVGKKAIEEAPTEVLGEYLKEWIDKSTNYDPDNRFESDRARGYRSNVWLAKLELLIRESGYSREDIKHLIDREGWAYGLAMTKGILQYLKTGKAVLKMENGCFDLVVDNPSSEDEKTE